MPQNLAKALLKPINTTAIVILGCLTLIWGMWVANPCWEAFDQSAIYSEMGSLGEPFWGLAAAICAVAMIYGAVRPSYKTLSRGAIMGYIFWLVLSIFYFIGDWQSPEGPVSLFLAIYCAFIWINNTVNRHTLPR